MNKINQLKATKQKREDFYKNLDEALDTLVDADDEATARKWAARTARWAAWKIAQGKK